MDARAPKVVMYNESEMLLYLTESASQPFGPPRIHVTTLSNGLPGLAHHEVDGRRSRLTLRLSGHDLVAYHWLNPFQAPAGKILKA